MELITTSIVLYYSSLYSISVQINYLLYYVCTCIYDVYE